MVTITKTTIKQLTELVIRFRDERNWKQFHNLKDLAISLSLESAELLEHVQWKEGEGLTSHVEEHKKEIGEELSDILYWTLLIAHDLNIDLANAFRAKMQKNASKYPIERSRNSNKKYNDLT